MIELKVPKTAVDDLMITSCDICKKEDKYMNMSFHPICAWLDGATFRLEMITCNQFEKINKTTED